MRRGASGRALRVLLTAVLGVGAVLLPLGLGAPTAAADTGPQVSISIDAMSPALPERDGSVRLRGKVTNTSDVPLTNLQATFWRGDQVITGRAAMTEALASAADQAPFGARVNPLTDFEPIPSAENRTLPPGKSTAFDLKVPVADLNRPPGNAVHLIGVHVLGRINGVGADLVLGRGRIFMPLVDTEPANPLRITSVVVLTSRPSLAGTGLLADDHLAAEVADGGRLDRLLDAAEQRKVSFVVDPAVIDTLETMRGGYQVLGVDGGEPTTGTGGPAAVVWLARFARLVADGDGFRLPYGNPDVAALAHDQQQGVLQQAATLGAQVAATRSLPLVVLPARGRADAATLQAAEALVPAAVLLSDRSTTQTAPLLAGPGGRPVVNFTAEALQGGPGPSPRNTAVKVRQRMLSDTWLEAVGTPPDGTAGRVRLITSPTQAASADSDLKVPWLRPTTLSELLARTPATWSGDLSYGATARAAEIGIPQRESVRDLAATYATLADLFVESTRWRAEGARIVPLTASADWRASRSRGRDYANQVEERLDDLLRGLSISAAPVFTTGRTGSFPLTVKSSFPAPGPDGTDPYAARVEVRFMSSNSQRLTVAELDLPEPVPGGGAVTRNAEAKPQTNGTVRVYARLYTRSGSPVGPSQAIDITATQAGTTGWVIAIVAGIVLVGSSALRIRRVTKQRAAAAAGGGGTPEALAVSRPPEPGDGGLHAGGAEEPPVDTRADGPGPDQPSGSPTARPGERLDA